MIYTVTFNPSIDYIMFADDFELNGLIERQKLLNLLEVRVSMFQECCKH